MPARSSLGSADALPLAATVAASAAASDAELEGPASGGGGFERGHAEERSATPDTPSAVSTIESRDLIFKRASRAPCSDR